MNEIAITFLIVVVVVLLFALSKVPVVIVAIGTALAFYATGILDLEETLSGLGDPAVLLIASLFVVSAGLDATGVTTWAGQKLITKAGKSQTRLLVLIMLFVAALTALISVNGSVAALLPMVVIMAVRLNRAPSKLLMPLVFGAHAGSMLALTGTAVNVLVAEAAGYSGGNPFGFFEFAIVGIPLLLGTIVIVVLLGPRLLPERRGRTIPPDLSKHARTLIEQYSLTDGLFQLRVRAHSPYVSVLPKEIDLKEYPGLTLISIHEGAYPKDPNRPLAPDDVLNVFGNANTAGSFAADKLLSFQSEPSAGDIAEALVNRTSGLGEIIIPPRSGLIGTTMFPGMITPSGDLVVVAVQRKGDDLGPKEAKLAAGDAVLLQGTWKALDQHLDDPDILVVDSPDVVRRQAVPMGAGAKQALAVLTFMVILIATGIVPAPIAGIVCASLMVLLGVLTVPQAYRSINWTTVILVGAMMPLSTAMTNTGAASWLADKLVAMVGDSGPYALLAGLFVLTAILGQIISNTATALIMIPISKAAAAALGISPRPVLMSLAVAAAAAFLTPIATPVNLMVMGPGGYRFGDYWKLGLPLLLWFFVVATFVVPIFWKF